MRFWLSIFLPYPATTDLLFRRVRSTPYCAQTSPRNVPHRLARAMVNEEVPRPYDKIQVLYELDSGELTWWPAVVTESSEQEAAGRMKGIATVEFAAMHGMKSCTMTLYFFANRALTSADGDSIWRTSAEAADDGDGDDVERDWGSSKVRCKARRSARVSQPRHAPIEVDSLSCGDGSDSEEITATPTNDTNMSARASQMHMKVPALPSTGQRANKSRKRGERPWEEDLASLKRQFDSLRRRVDVRADAREEALTMRIVNANRNVWKVRLMEKMDKSIKEHEPRSERVFSEALQVGSIRISDMADFETFQDIVSNMGQRTDWYQPRGVHFIPSLLEITNPARDIYEAHVLFDKLSTLLRWFGMTSEADLCRNLVKHEKGRKGVLLTRVIGGSQFKENETQFPVRVFVGASCVPAHMSTAELEGDGISSPTIHFPNSIWDESNNVFATQPIWYYENGGRIASMGERLDSTAKKSVFSVSWVWRRTTGGRGYSSHGRKTGLMRIGDISINLPYAVFRGATTCEDVRSLLSSNSIEECI